ncbi:MAG: hypothetical protein JW741_05870 [Sedimentisphaerales bacterium]|nr:hypothetical protein [Sedimentisphaerales bacterium]
MSAIESRAKLVQAAKKLRREWAQVQEMWRDENCRQFEKNYMEPLEADVRAAVVAFERVGTMLHNAQQDCGPSKEVN